MIPLYTHHFLVTGKPTFAGGIDGRLEATGRGVFFGIREFVSNAAFMESVGLTSGLKGKRIVVQGYGNVGYWASRFLYEEGAIIVGVSEMYSGIYSSSGFDPEELHTFRLENDSFADFPGVEKSFGEEEVDLLLEQACDILIPCALQQTIHQENAAKVQAKLVCGMWGCCGCF